MIDFISIEKGNIFPKRSVSSFILYDYFKESKSCYTFKKNETKVTDFSLCLFSLRVFIKQKLEEKISFYYLNNLKLDSHLTSRVTDKFQQHILAEFCDATLSFEEELYCKEILNDTETIKNKKKFILEVSNSQEWTEYFFEKYPVLYFIISRFIEKNITYVANIISSIDTDFIEICNKLLMPEGNIIIHDIEVLKGDLHFDNLSVSIISLKNNTNNIEKIIYKPRNLYNEEWVSNIIKQTDINFIKVPDNLNKGKYGYLAYIEEDPNEKINYSLNDFYYKMGVLTGFLHQLGIEDIISDNLIYKTGNFYLIDLESILIPYFNIKENTIKKGKLESSILRTGVLPSFFEKDSYSFSPLYPQSKGIKISEKIKDLLSKENLLFLRDSTKNFHFPQKYINSIKEHNIYQYSLDFQKGFIFYNSKYPVKITSLIEKNISNKIKSRILLRNTQAYFNLLKKSKRPFYLTSNQVYIKLIQDSIYKSKGNDLIKRDELSQLLINDIPYFSISITLNKIYNYKNYEIENELDLYSHNYSYKNLKNNFKYNLYILQSIFLFSRASDYSNNYFLSKLHNLYLRNDSSEIVDLFVKNLTERVNNNEIDLFIDIKKLEFNRLRYHIQERNMSLFSGYSGDYFFLLNYLRNQKVINFQLLDLISEMIDAQIKNYMEKTKKETLKFSAYLFPCSVLINYLILRSLDSKNRDEEFEHLILSDFNSSLKEDNEFPVFLNSKSSFLLFLINNFELISNNDLILSIIGSVMKERSVKVGLLLFQKVD